MASWKDKGHIIIVRELRRWSKSPQLPGGPLHIVRARQGQYELSYHGQRIRFRDGRGAIGGVTYPETEGGLDGRAGPYRQSARQATERYVQYREQRARAMMQDVLSDYSLSVPREDRWDVRGFLIFGSYVRAVRNLLALARLSKQRANQLQRGSGYACLDHRDEL